jgi:hypothetical protein
MPRKAMSPMRGLLANLRLDMQIYASDRRDIWRTPHLIFVLTKILYRLLATGST